MVGGDHILVLGLARGEGLNDLAEGEDADRKHNEFKPLPEMRLSEGEAERAGVEVRADAAEDDADQNHPDRLGYRARGQRDGADKPHDHQREILGRAEAVCDSGERRSEEHTSELQSLMRTSYAAL